MDYQRDHRPASTSLNAVPTAPPTDSPSRIRDSVSNTEQFLSNIHDAIGSLERRLDTVLAPAMPTGSSTPSSAQVAKSSSHLFGRLDILNDGLSHAVARLNDIAQRVEV